MRHVPGLPASNALYRQLSPRSFATWTGRSSCPTLEGIRRSFSASRTNTPKRSIASIEEYSQRISRALASILVFPRRDRRFEIILIGRVGSLPCSSQYTRTRQRQTEKQGAVLLTATKMWLSGGSIHEKGSLRLSTGTSGFWLSDVESGCLIKLGTTVNTNGFFYTKCPSP
jgi:hypothetical protein